MALVPADHLKQISGSAITATSTNINGGSALNPGTSTRLDSVAIGNPSAIFGSQIILNRGSGNRTFFTLVGVVATSVASGAGGFCAFTKNSHGLVVGDVLVISGATAVSLNTIHVITAKTTNTFTTDVPYTASGTAGTYRKTTGSIRTIQSVIRGVTTSLAGISNTTMQSPASNYGRNSIHKVITVRTNKVATAIRAGYWNFYSGTWSTQPSLSEDSTDFGTDDAANPSYAVPGELVYLTPSVVTENYDAKTL